jgi:hypothetical protein
MEKTKRWDPRCDECIEAFYELAKKLDSYSQIAAVLDKRFLPSSPKYDGITASALIGSVTRGILSASLRRRYPKDADNVLLKFKAKSKSQSQPRPKSSGWRALNFSAPRAKPAAAARPKTTSGTTPRRKPDPEAARQSKAIEQYLSGIRK